MRVLTPARRRGIEILDDPATPAAVRARALHDVTRSNALFGGTRAMVAELGAVFDRWNPRALGPSASLLDVGTGLADIPDRVSARARARNVRLTTVGLDAAESLAGASRARLTFAVCGSALALPFGPQSFDIVTCSQLLHHFEEHEAIMVVREMHRVARHVAIVGDLRRSWLAAAGFWLAAVPLGFHPVTRHDGVVSILRGFTGAELLRIVAAAAPDARVAVRRHAGFRLTAAWSPAGAPPP